VLIQTRQPEHPSFSPVLKSDYSAIAEKELEERQYCELPPYSKMLSIRAESPHPENSLVELDNLKNTSLSSFINCPNVQIAGPIEASIARKSGIYRSFLHLFITDFKVRSAIIQTLRTYLDTRKPNKTKLYIDADPLDYV
jgi:primosomal protein N' (replication factor Y)